MSDLQRLCSFPPKKGSGTGIPNGIQSLTLPNIRKL
jgi:hypothetical protein